MSFPNRFVPVSPASDPSPNSSGVFPSPPSHNASPSARAAAAAAAAAQQQQHQSSSGSSSQKASPHSGSTASTPPNHAHASTSPLEPAATPGAGFGGTPPQAVPWSTVSMSAESTPNSTPLHNGAARTNIHVKTEIKPTASTELTTVLASSTVSSFTVSKPLVPTNPSTFPSPSSSFTAPSSSSSRAFRTPTPTSLLAVHNTGSVVGSASTSANFRSHSPLPAPLPRSTLRPVTPVLSAMNAAAHSSSSSSSSSSSAITPTPQGSSTPLRSRSAYSPAISDGPLTPLVSTDPRSPVTLHPRAPHAFSPAFDSTYPDGPDGEREMLERTWSIGHSGVPVSPATAGQPFRPTPPPSNSNAMNNTCPSPLLIGADGCMTPSKTRQSPRKSAHPYRSVSPSPLYSGYPAWGDEADSPHFSPKPIGRGLLGVGAAKPTRVVRKGQAMRSLSSPENVLADAALLMQGVRREGMRSPLDDVHALASDNVPTMPIADAGTSVQEGDLAAHREGETQENASSTPNPRASNGKNIGKKRRSLDRSPNEEEGVALSADSADPSAAAPPSRKKSGSNSGVANFHANGKPKVCGSCGTRKTPYWRDGWNGVCLCNACGIRYKKRKVACSHCSYVPRKDERARYCPRCNVGFFE